jgi:hypothetical protein
MGLSFTIAAVFARAVILRPESRGVHDHILLSQIWDSSNLEHQVHVFISPKNRVARLYPQTLGYVTESALQGRLYSVSVSIVDYSYPRELFIDYLAIIFFAFV